MREATARYEPDYTLSDESAESKPRRRRKTVSPAAARAAENRARLMAVLAYTIDNPVKVLGTACLTIAAISFAVNALFFQQGRHPAPLFAPKPTTDNATPAPAVATPAPATPLVAVPPQRPVELQAKKDAAPQAAAVPQGRDAIGDLLRGGVVTTPPADPKQEQVRSVAAIQRALNRLGYGPVKADGIFGSGTKLALERFERDRKLPVTGEISPRVLKELAAASGTAFD